MSDITKQSLSELVENIKSKKLSSSEVTKAFVERSEMLILLLDLIVVE